MNALNDQPVILVVDDEARLRESVSAMLKLNGYEFYAVNGGQSAIDVLKQRTFALILLDLCMPEVDGHQVMQWMKEHSNNTCVIVVSGDTSIDSAISALRNGAYDFIRKPYEAEDLILKVQHAVLKLNLEKENSRIYNQLRESERWYRYMVNNSPDVIYTLDAEGCFTFLNDRTETLLGFNKAALLGRHFSELVHKEDFDLANHFTNITNTIENDARSAEIRIPHANREMLLTLEFNSFGIYDKNSAKSGTQCVGTYGVAKDITEKKNALELISYQAYHDLLTGLANRTMFKDHLELAMAQAARYKHMFALMFLDLDRFKVVNDTLGHDVGDLLLIKVAERLNSCIREGDTLARQGGDEFTLLLPQLHDVANAESAVDKILKSFNQPFLINEHELHVTMSIGISIYPEHGENVDLLMKNADIAMYESKSGGRNCYQIYTQSMNATFDDKFSLEAQMRKALDREEFRVVYQPQINIKTRKISGMETLVRWTSPVLGQLSPAEFIPVAEEIGLIIPISEFVLRSAFSQAKLWKRAGILIPRIAINISSLHLEQANFVTFIKALLDEYDLDGSIFELEITEGSLLSDGNHIIEKLQSIANLGMTIALDDFGTGYSCLSYLNKFPIDTIKIDRSFMRNFPSDTNNKSIVTAICSLAKGMNKNLIAEGVEKIEQINLLEAMDCNEAQGYLFSKPISSHDITVILTEDAPLNPRFLSTKYAAEF